MEVFVMTDQTPAAAGKISRTQQLTLMGLMTAAVCVAAPFSVPIPVSPVPLTLTNFVLYIAVYILGMKLAAVSCAAYLILGAAGLPVFSSFSGGLGKLAGPTGGYLVGFIFLVLIQGFLMKSRPGSSLAAAAGMILGTAVCYIFGTVWLGAQSGLPFSAALSAGVIPYLPGDTVKIIAAAVLGPKLQAAVKRV